MQDRTQKKNIHYILKSYKEQTKSITVNLVDLSLYIIYLKLGRRGYRKIIHVLVNFGLVFIYCIRY